MAHTITRQAPHGQKLENYTIMYIILCLCCDSNSTAINSYYYQEFITPRSGVMNS